jgi:hypothetical protein
MSRPAPVGSQTLGIGAAGRQSRNRRLIEHCARVDPLERGRRWLG